MSKGKKVILGVVMLSAAAYIVAAPYITVYQMKTTAENHDGEALSEYIDFPSVRQSLKEQMNVMVTNKMRIRKIILLQRWALHSRGLW